MEMEFGVRVATHSILKEVNNGCYQKNLVFSPLSLHICLNLLTAGAKGPTLDQLLRFLGSKNIAQINAQSSLLMEVATAKSDPSDDIPVDPIIWLVDGIWVDQRSSLKHSFKQLANDVYKAKSQSLDFKKAEQVADEINAWARQVSKGHIDNLVSPESLQASVLILASALYFQASWIEKFDLDLTEAEDFHLLNGEQVRVQFMKQWYSMSFYREFTGFKLLKMRYEKAKDNKNYAMHIFLPDQHDGLPELIEKFHSDPKFFTTNHKLQYIALHKLWLPKLKFEYGLDISNNIRELGLDLPFMDNAELTDIVDSKDNVYVSKVVHKSYIEVNEEGTCAASITEIEDDVGYNGDIRDIIVPPISFVADHPFLFMIKEEVSGIVLFVGAVFNPVL